MLGDQEFKNAVGRDAYGSDDEKIGKIGQIYLDDETGEPEFMTVSTGLFGTSESFIPLREARLEGDRVVVPYTKDQVKDAPNVDVEGRHLDEAEEQRLYEHYEMSYTPYGVNDTVTSEDYVEREEMPGVVTGDSAMVGTEGYDTSGPTTDEAMTRSEERLDVGTRSEEAGRVRLRKYVETETETVQVPVQKERAYIEREPITEGNVGDALEGPEISEEEHEVILHEEHAVAGTVTEPVERVRIGVETDTEEETVSEEVRKERIETEGDVEDRKI